MKSSDQLTENKYVVTYSVGPGQNGIRLDSFLKDQYRRRSREQIKKAIESGAITIKREQGAHLTLGKLKPATQLLSGDEVLVLSEKKPEPPVCFDYKILYEDDVLLVIDKPANLPVHPAGRYFFNTLLIHLRTHGHRAPLKGDVEHEYFLAHRIDKETSGILVMAKTSEACAHLVKQFAERKTSKRYLAIVRGTPERDEFQVDLALRRSTHSVVELKMCTAPESDGGQSAMTYFRRLGTYGDFSLVECFPKTGRQHQIRVHLEAVGHPIVGDKLYGIPEEESRRFYERQHLSPEAQARLLLPRHALHASSIQIEHPHTGKPIEFNSELPQELQAFLDQQQTLTPRGLPTSVRPPVAEVSPAF